MWLFFVIIDLLAFASTDLLAKKRIDSGDAAVPAEMLISTYTLVFGIGIILSVLGLGESGLPPWEILWVHPLIVVNVCCFFMYWLLYLYSLRYIGVTLESAVCSTNGILYFAGLCLIHVFCGKLTEVNDILRSARLIPVLFVLFFVFLLPNVELLSRKAFGTMSEHWKKERHNIVIGMQILFLGMLFDTGDSLLITLIFDEGNIGIVDFLKANYFAAFFPTVLFLLFMRKKQEKWFIPFKKDTRFTICYSCTAVTSSLLYLIASSIDAVRTGIVFLAAPVFPIIGARILLKEKYTWKQNLCIWIIIIAVTAFCVADYIS